MKHINHPFHINRTLIEILKEIKEPVLYTDTIIKMLDYSNTVEWVKYFPEFHIVLQGAWLESGRKGYISDPAEFHKAAAMHPDWYFECHHKMFTDADWIHFFEHYPELVNDCEVERIYPDVYERFKDRLKHKNEII